jgi:hypothetical protein
MQPAAGFGLLKRCDEEEAQRSGSLVNRVRIQLPFPEQISLICDLVVRE